MKKIICILFALLMLLPLFVSCSEKKPTEHGDDTKDLQEQTTAAPAETEAPEILPDLPDVTFKNYEFTVFLQGGGYKDDFYCEDHDTGESLHDAVRRRNTIVCDQYQITLNVLYDEYSAVNAAIQRSVNAGTHDYDLCFVHMVSGAALAQGNYVLAFEKLPYVNLDKPWWDKSIRNGFSINNNLMMVNGDISPASFSTTSCLYFNKTLFDRYDLEYPYELVRDGKWTLDELYELTKDFTKDIDGDSKIEPIGGTDIFGLASWYLDVPYSFYYGAGGMLVTKDENDTPHYDPQLERDTNIYTKIYDVIIKNQAYFETDSSATNFPNVAKVFSDGRALFYDAKLASAEELRDMDDDFGILPIPKYSAAQEDYYSFVNGSSNMVCVPATCSSEEMRERTSILIEAFAYQAYKTVTPVLIETYLKRKVTRDYQSQDMIDFIVRNRVFDMAYVNMHDGVGSFVRDMLVKKSTDVSSTFKRYSKTAKNKIDKIVEAFEKSIAQE